MVLAFLIMKRLLITTTMKSGIATILIALSMLLTSSTFAIGPPPYQAEAQKAVSQLLQEELEYPDFALKQQFQCCVLVSLKINTDGSFSVECLNCVNDKMKTHVKKEIEEIYMKDFSKYSGCTINLKIKYKLI